MEPEKMNNEVQDSALKKLEILYDTELGVELNDYIMAAQEGDEVACEKARAILVDTCGWTDEELVGTLAIFDKDFFEEK